VPKMLIESTPSNRVLACAAVLLCAACAKTPDVDPVYRPPENVLEVIAVLRAHIPDDTYHFQPARDFTGRNVYRSALLRLENLEMLHADALRAGHMDGVIAFGKARALERLHAFELAAESYRLAADLNKELKIEALRSADICDGLNRAANMRRTSEPSPASIASETASANGSQSARFINLDPGPMLVEFEARVALLDDLAQTTEGTHYQALVAEELERADLARANFFVGTRRTHVDGDVRAVAELQRVVGRHTTSKNFNRHLLRLADLFAELAIEYKAIHPPESLLFDPVRFGELVDGATRLYEMVARRDGTPEKLEASRRLEAFLAFSIQVDRDRFTP
jgi:hypothetical protein